MTEREESAREIWRNRELPCQRHIVFKDSNWCIRMSEWCQICAGRDHTTRRCNKKMVPCPVRHYQGIQHPPHTVLVCPQLHSYCHVCKLRGHMEQLHPNLHQTPRELRQDFMAYCHQGFYTSLPYLYEHGGVIQNFHWKSTLMACRMTRGQGDMWLYRGLGYALPQDMVDARKAKQDLVRRNLDSTATTYQRMPIE